MIAWLLSKLFPVPLLGMELVRVEDDPTRRRVVYDTPKHLKLIKRAQAEIAEQARWGRTR